MNYADIVGCSRYLYRGMLSTSIEDDLMQVPLSPASIQATRLCSTGTNKFSFASHNKVYDIECIPPRKRLRNDGSTISGDVDNNDENTNDKNIVKEAMVEDFLIPEKFSKLKSNKNFIHSIHENEIQSIKYSDENKLLSSIDAYGRVIISNNRNDKFYLTPNNKFHGIKGWTGIDYLQNNDKIITIRQMYKDISVYDTNNDNIITQNINTLLNPSSMKTVGEHLILTTQNNHIIVYDIRINGNKQRNNFAFKKLISNSNLYTIDSRNNMIVASGIDRTVHCLDIRNTTNGLLFNINDNRWNNCLKYECTGLLLSEKFQNSVYCCSIDNEVACGIYDNQLVSSNMNNKGQNRMLSGALTRNNKRLFGFRADVRVTGMSKGIFDMSGEYIASITETGAFYLLRSS